MHESPGASKTQHSIAHKQHEYIRWTFALAGKSSCICNTMFRIFNPCLRDLSYLLSTCLSSMETTRPAPDCEHIKAGPSYLLTLSRNQSSMRCHVLGTRSFCVATRQADW